MSDAQKKEYLTVGLSDIPRAARGTSSDYLSAVCQQRDDEGNCTQYTHQRDTPTSDESGLAAV